MNIFVMVDMEGISGINCTDQTGQGKPLYDEGRQMITSDITACVEGAVLGGAKRIVVRDAHSRGQNFRWLDLPAGAEYIIGPVGGQRMPQLEDFDAVILLGYHAMAGTAQAMLEHTWSADTQNLWLNGRKTGEIGLDAAIAGEYGKPVVLVTGDDKACAEAREFIPGVITAQVKAGLGLYGGRMLSKTASQALIREQTAMAIGRIAQIKPLPALTPVTLRVEVTERTAMPSLAEKPYARIIDTRTFEVDAKSVEEAIFRF